MKLASGDATFFRFFLFLIFFLGLGLSEQQFTSLKNLPVTRIFFNALFENFEHVGEFVFVNPIGFVKVDDSEQGVDEGFKSDDLFLVRVAKSDPVFYINEVTFLVAVLKLKENCLVHFDLRAQCAYESIQTENPLAFAVF